MLCRATHRSLPASALALIIFSAAATVASGAGTAEASNRLSSFWSLQPLQPVSVPEGDMAWTKNTVDRFVFARLAQAGLKPSPAADRPALLRRVSFDLTGLPPTPRELQAFLADPSPNAYEKVVDQLLASPRYGERWARHWLDVVRFAETHGYEMNQPRPNAWPYRDYVIQAFNEDKPYDQFVREQIAGDLLGAEAATGFLVGGPWDQVKSPDVVLTLNQRADEVHDMISTTASTFLGLTVGCARCHDHKFDPISQREYYGMKAIFDGVQHGERALPSPDHEPRLQRLATLKVEAMAWDAKIAAFEPLASPLRMLLLDDAIPSSDTNASVTQCIERKGLEPHKSGMGRGEANDPGDATRIPNLGQNYSYWDHVSGRDVFTWNPKRVGKWKVFISWGCGWKTHAADARYVLDADGNLQTREDQIEIARVDQRKFADEHAEIPGASLWSGFYFAGSHELRPESRIILRGGTNDSVVTADLLLLEEDSGNTSKSFVPHLRSSVSARRNVDRVPTVQANFLRFVIEATTDVEPCLDELEVIAPDSTNNLARMESVTVTSSGDYAGDPSHKLEYLTDGRYGNERSWISNERGHGWVQLAWPEKVRIDRVIWSRDRSSPPKYEDRVPTRYHIEVSDDATQWHTVASDHDRLPRSPGHKTKEVRVVEGLEPSAAAEVNALWKRKNTLDAEMQELMAVPKVYAGNFKEPEPTRRLNRGEATQPREIVSPALLGALRLDEGSVNLSTNTPEKERRLALAEWISSTNNPLTARVMVNRLWLYHFGEGLVATPSDFGGNGVKPSHPELLDWLAAELMRPAEGRKGGSRPGWSLKHLQRLIVCSATYRQASAARADGLAADANTRLLWRFPPRRLEAEAIRDSILFVAGRLDLRMGGPGWSAFEPNDNYVRVYAPKNEFENEDFRRMVYATIVRQRPEGVFGAFDCPDGGQIAPRRSRSTTPLQALNLLNSRFVMQAAGFLADRLKSEAGDLEEAQVRRAFSLVFGRIPSRDELTSAMALVRKNGLLPFCRALFNANEFVYLF